MLQPVHNFEVSLPVSASANHTHKQNKTHNTVEYLVNYIFGTCEPSVQTHHLPTHDPPPRSPRSSRTVILARVAVGDAHHATETVKRTDRRPPARDLFERYDSTVADAGPMTNHSSGWQTHQEFVVFTQEQAYPAFVAQYVLS